MTIWSRDTEPRVLIGLITYADSPVPCFRLTLFKLSPILTLCAIKPLASVNTVTESQGRLVHSKARRALFAVV
jgi:hypothetical protein